MQVRVYIHNQTVIFLVELFFSQANKLLLKVIKNKKTQNNILALFCSKFLTEYYSVLDLLFH